jgi:hypothetical protein
MKNLSAVLLSGCLLGLATTMHGQPQRLYVAVDYMQIPENKSEQDYIGLEKLWMRIHQKAADAGICKAWYLERVENGGRNQFVTLRVYDSLDKMAQPWPDSLTKGLYNSQEEAQMNQTAQIRHLTRSELWEIEASALKNLEGEREHYATIDFMKPKPDKDAEYYKTEKEIFRKLHKARVDAGVMSGWYFLSRMFPSGYDSEYDYITANIYTDKAASEKPVDVEKLAKEALSKDEIDKAMAVLDLRTVVRQEVWHSVLRVVPSKK